MNEMVRRRVGLRLGSLNEEDHRYAHCIDRHRSRQDHLARNEKATPTPEEVRGLDSFTQQRVFELRREIAALRLENESYQRFIEEQSRGQDVGE
jgi:thymidylate synthase ThyX